MSQKLCFWIVEASLSEGEPTLDDVKKNLTCATNAGKNIFDSFKKKLPIALPGNPVAILLSAYAFGLIARDDAAAALQIAEALGGENGINGPPAHIPRDQILVQYNILRLQVVTITVNHLLGLVAKFFSTLKVGSLINTAVDLFKNATHQMVYITVTNLGSYTWENTGDFNYKGYILTNIDKLCPPYAFRDGAFTNRGVFSSNSGWHNGAASAIQFTTISGPHDVQVRFIIAGASPMLWGDNTLLLKLNENTVKEVADWNDSKGVQRDEVVSVEGKIVITASVESKGGGACHVRVKITDLPNNALPRA